MRRSPAKRSVSPSSKRPRGREKASASPEVGQKMSPKLVAFVRKQWPARGRAERIARAKQAWEEAMKIAATFKKVDAETLKWIAEDPDLEYL